MSIDTQSHQSTKKPIFLRDYTAPNFTVSSVTLHFDIQSDHTVVETTAHYQRADHASSEAPLVLAGESLELKSVAIDGQALSQSDYQLDDKSLTLHNLSDAFECRTVVHIYPKTNTTLMGLYESSGNLCTQCEPHGFRRITYFMDRPDVMTRFITTIEADKNEYPHLLSNGNLIESKDLDNDRLWVKWEDPSLKPCYLFALVAGRFDVLEDTFETRSGRSVQLRFFLELGYGNRGQHALDSLKRAMQWDEEVYGREYDLDIYMVVAVSDFNFGAMENKGLNVFNTSCVLASQDQATDDDFIRVEDVIGHEYFHNWSGNRITCRDWFQLTLKEGLTVFRDQCFSEDMTGTQHTRLQEVALVRNAQFAEDASPLAHPIRPQSYIEMNNFYTHTVYRKGAEVIRMLHTLMGNDAFHRAMDLYFERFDGMAVTTDDFLSVMKETDPNLDLDAFLNWYNVAGTPILTVTGSYDQSKSTYTLHVKQTLKSGLQEGEQAPESPFYFPLAMGLYSSDGTSLPTQLVGESESETGTRVLVVNQHEQEFVFQGVSGQPIPSLLHRFSAPIELRFDYTDDELFLLWQYGDDAFVRDMARQTVFSRCIYKAADACAGGETMVLSPQLKEVISHLLSETAEDLSIQAQLLSMPAHTYLLAHAQGRNISDLAHAYLFYQRSLSEALKSQWLERYESLPFEEYKTDRHSIGQRRLRSVCLAGLLGSGGEDAQACAFQQFKSSNNMTDTLAALVALNDHEGTWRDDVMESFLARWQNEPLVLCKWLRLEASRRSEQSYETVKGLMTCDVFDWNRPNIVMALFGSFASNWWGFHREDGAGYRLLRDAIQKLNSINPQVAARLVRPLCEWQPLDETRQAMMRGVLAEIAGWSDVSPAVYEIASMSQ